MSQWYLSKNGQALGPLDTDKVKALIQSKELNPMDLIYRQGESEWRPAIQVDEFAPLFNQAPPAPEPVEHSNTESKEWVLLKKVMKEDGGKEYQQLGPFSQMRVMTLLDEGEISFTDFAWKQGMESWEKIAKIEDFDEPLPSSPSIDNALYEKTQLGDIPTDTIEKTVIDEAQRASMTELVNIERFDHQKTQVYMNEKLDEAMDPQSKLNVPINTQDFVTDSGLNEDESESGVSLWSLEPPKSVDNIEPPPPTERKKAARPKTKKQKAQRRPAPQKPKKRKQAPAREDYDRVTLGERLSSMDPETGLWAVAVIVMLISAFALYRSLQPENGDVAMDVPGLSEPISEPAQQAQPVQNDDEQRRIQAAKIAEIQEEYRKKLAEQSREIQLKEAALMQQKKKNQELAELAQQKEALEERLRLEEQARIKALDAQRLEYQQKKQRELASQKAEDEKKKRLAAQAAKMSASKKTSKPKKKAAPKKIVKTSKATKVARPSGGQKAQAFYKQRDRKALFYSSLKAEQLVVELESEFEKLRGNKSAWGKFYSGWRRKVNSSLSADIRAFPKRREKYAYPKIIAEFKKDYKLFYKYGESFNAKINGGRVPSGSPAGMRGVFDRYRKQALSLGR